MRARMRSQCGERFLFLFLSSRRVATTQSKHMYRCHTSLCTAARQRCFRCRLQKACWKWQRMCFHSALKLLLLSKKLKSLSKSEIALLSLIRGETFNSRLREVCHCGEHFIYGILMQRGVFTESCSILSLELQNCGIHGYHVCKTKCAKQKSSSSSTFELATTSKSLETFQDR